MIKVNYRNPRRIRKLLKTIRTSLPLLASEKTSRKRTTYPSIKDLANRLKVREGTVNRWEKTKPPEYETLRLYLRLAEQYDLTEEAQALRLEIHNSLEASGLFADLGINTEDAVIDVKRRSHRKYMEQLALALKLPQASEERTLVLAALCVASRVQLVEENKP